MENQTKSSITADKQEKQLQAILYLLQEKLDEFKNEVDSSYELLKIGEKTELSKQIENSIENPIESLFNTSKLINTQIKDILDRLVVSFLHTKKNVINSAYKNSPSSSQLSYSIVLNEDTNLNREKVFEFFNLLYSLEFSDEFPIAFQIVPIELIGKIETKEVINL
jgi:hypothetical protein